VPGSPVGTPGIPPAELGITVPGITLPSQQGAAGAAAGPHGSQTGPQGAASGAWQGSARRPQGERNSMKDGRRQPLPPPKQLLQPGDAARAARQSARQMTRDMTNFSSGRIARATSGWNRHRGVAATTATLGHDCGRGRPGRRKSLPVSEPGLRVVTVLRMIRSRGIGPPEPPGIAC
jgi:hypothetical protein